MAYDMGSMDLARAVYEGLEKHWSEASAGVHRPGYSDEENEAIELIAKQARAMGMEESFDAAGNAYFIYPGSDRGKPVMMIGSHVDAVPSGGRYDGTAGVIAGMSALRQLHDQGIKPPQDVCVTVFRGEESAWYGMSCMGSKFITGELGSDFMRSAQHKGTGEVLSSRMQKCGINTDALAAKLDAGQVFPLERIGGYIEVHIEQGPALLQAEKSLGIVTAIRGHVRYPNGIVFEGKAAHSGSTPQNMRKDAAIASAYFVSDWARQMERFSKEDDLVFSVPDIRVENPSSTTIPKKCFVQPEVRSTSEDMLKKVETYTNALFADTVQDRSLQGGYVSAPVIGKPAVMDGRLQVSLQKAVEKLGFSFMSMPSGAGHDAGILANAGVPAVVLFIRHGLDGISHNSSEILALDEGMDPFAEDGDFCKAVRSLAEVIKEGVDTGTRFPAVFQPGL